MARTPLVENLDRDGAPFAGDAGVHHPDDHSRAQVRNRANKGKGSGTHVERRHSVREVDKKGSGRMPCDRRPKHPGKLVGEAVVGEKEYGSPVSCHRIGTELYGRGRARRPHRLSLLSSPRVGSGGSCSDGLCVPFGEVPVEVVLTYAERLTDPDCRQVPPVNKPVHGHRGDAVDMSPPRAPLGSAGPFHRRLSVESPLSAGDDCTPVWSLRKGAIVVTNDYFAPPSSFERSAAAATAS